MNNIKIFLRKQNISLVITSPNKIMEVIWPYVKITVDCGGKGTCGKCKVKVKGNVSGLTNVEYKFLSPEEIGRGIRLACQTYINGDVVIETLEEQWQSLGKAVFLENKWEINPAVKKNKRCKFQFLLYMTNNEVIGKDFMML